MSNAYRGILLANLIKPDKTWYKTLDAITKAPNDYPIYLSINTPAYYFFKDRVQHHDKAWKLINEKLTIITWEQLIGENVIRDFFLGKCAIFASSYKFESIKSLERDFGFKDLFSFDLVFDKVNDLRLFRKDYEFSDKIIKM